MSWNGIGVTLGNLMRIAEAETCLVTAENVFGKKGAGAMAEVGDTPQADVAALGQLWERSTAARDLGTGWKVRPCITVPKAGSATLMDVEGSGVIQHIWITADLGHNWGRDLILRMFWDGEETASVEVPLGDFFCNATGCHAKILAQPINVNPHNGMNCYFPMPFRSRARITIENRNPSEDRTGFFYAITFARCQVSGEEAHFQAQFRRSNPLPYEQDHTILDGVRGRGHFVGCYLAWQQNNDGWWGEGEVKMYMDGDRTHPSYCGTGTEDYFGGAWCFGGTFSAPFLGYPAGGKNKVGGRHGMYRFHVLDPVRFREEIRVTIQAIGWRSGGRYLPLQDDIASVAYWYQIEPHTQFPVLGGRDALEVI